MYIGLKYNFKVLWQTKTDFFFLIKQYHLSPLEFDGKALNGIQSNRIGSKVPFTFPVLISLLYHLPRVWEKCYWNEYLWAKAEFRKPSLAGTWQKERLEDHRPGSGSAALPNHRRWDALFLDSWLVYNQKEMVFSRVFASTRGCLCSLLLGHT